VGVGGPEKSAGGTVVFLWVFWGSGGFGPPPPRGLAQLEGRMWKFKTERGASPQRGGEKLRVIAVKGQNCCFLEKGKMIHEESCKDRNNRGL